MTSPVKPERITDCTACNESFLLPDSVDDASTIGCPSCGVRMPLALLKTREIQVAELFSPSAALEPDPTPTAQAVEAPEPAPQDDAAPTLAEWLTRENPLQSLTDSIDKPAEQAPAPEAASLTSSVEKPARDDFSFDFASAPLEPESEQTAEPTYQAPASQDPIPLAIPQTNKKKRPLLTAAASVMVLAAGAGGAYYYYGVYSAGSDSLQASAADNRAARSDLASLDNAPEFILNNEAIDDPEQSTVAPPNYREQDGAITASYERDVEPAAAFVPSTDPPATGDRYGAPADDRYAASDAPEKNPFAAAEEANLAAGESPLADVPVEPAAVEPTADEPLMLPWEMQQTVEDEPTVPEVGQDGAPRIVDAPEYSPAELQQAIEAASGSATGLAEVDLNNPDDVPAVGQHYARLCYLAQVSAFASDAAEQEGQPDPFTLQIEAEGIFLAVFEDQRSRDAASQVAGPWIAWDKRPHGGVLFSAAPVGSDTEGELAVYRFELGGEEVTVVTAEPVVTRSQSWTKPGPVGVVGVVVDQPASNLSGYDGNEPRVIWAPRLLTLTPSAR